MAKKEFHEKLTTKEIARKYAKKYNISIAKSEEFIFNFLKLWKDLVKDGNSLMFYGVGSVNVYTAPKEEVRNPLTNKMVLKGERQKVKFSYSNLFKEEIE